MHHARGRGGILLAARAQPGDGFRKEPFRREGTRPRVGMSEDGTLLNAGQALL